MSNQVRTPRRDCPRKRGIGKSLAGATVTALLLGQGFRSIAWEDDWSLGTQIDDYIMGHRDDRDALIAQMSTAWHTEEVADVLHWLRTYNKTHEDKVRFVGVESSSCGLGVQPSSCGVAFQP